jgi:hypothetical protein
MWFFYPLAGNSLTGEILMTALYCGGQATRQEPHFTHFSGSMIFFIARPVLIASTGQLPTQASQERSHFSGIM